MYNGLSSINTFLVNVTARYPVEDAQATINVSAWMGVPVQLIAIYKPFEASVTAMSEDELKALRDLAYVQADLDRAHKKIATYQRKETFLQNEVNERDILPEDKAETEKCKKYLKFLLFLLVFV